MGHTYGIFTILWELQRSFYSPTPQLTRILLFTLLRAEFLLWLSRKWNTVTKGPAKAKKLFPSGLFAVVCATQYFQWVPLETPKPLRTHILDRWRVSTDCIGGALGSGGAQELLSVSSMGWQPVWAKIVWGGVIPCAVSSPLIYPNPQAVMGELSGLGKLLSSTQGKPNGGLDGSPYTRHIPSGRGSSIPTAGLAGMLVQHCRAEGLALWGEYRSLNARLSAARQVQPPNRSW